MILNSFLLNPSIVALHGLNGHAFKTFRSKDAGVMWLRDLLPKDFPHSRIMIYGYNANVFTNTSTAKIADFRQALLTSLERMRRTAEVCDFPKCPRCCDCSI
jgi:hypothetical protein